MINVRELINDPDFAQPQGIHITRYRERFENHRTVKESEDIVVKGILILLDANSDTRQENFDNNVDELTILTYDRLKCEGIDKIDGLHYGSDVVHYMGADYIVKSCQDLSQYGYCRSKATKLEQDVM